MIPIPIPELKCPEEIRQGCHSQFNNQADLIFHLVVGHKWPFAWAEATVEQMPESHDALRAT